MCRDGRGGGAFRVAMGTLQVVTMVGRSARVPPCAARSPTLDFGGISGEHDLPEHLVFPVPSGQGPNEQNLTFHTTLRRPTPPAHITLRGPWPIQPRPHQKTHGRWETGV